MRLLLAGALLATACAQADLPREVRLILPEQEVSGGVSWGWLVPLAALACVGGGVLVFWGVRGVLPWQWWAQRPDRAAVQPPPALTSRDLDRVARACGHDARTQASLSDAARRMGLATPLGLFLLPHTAEPEAPPTPTRTAPNPAAASKRRPR